jgi:hypothetical protein
MNAINDSYVNDDDDDRPRSSVSSNHFSVDQQAVDAMTHLQHHHEDNYATVIAEFPEFESYKFQSSTSSWFDTDAMGVDIEWGSWLIDKIEQTSDITWEDGEPFCYDTECAS